MKNKINAKTKTEMYTVRFWIKNKETGFFEEKVEEAYSFGKDDHEKISKEFENKYRGKGYKIRIVSVIHA